MTALSICVALIMQDGRATKGSIRAAKIIAKARENEAGKAQPLEKTWIRYDGKEPNGAVDPKAHKELAEATPQKLTKLLADKRAFLLEQNTAAEIIKKDKGLNQVRILDGRHAGAVMFVRSAYCRKESKPPKPPQPKTAVKK